MEDLKDSQNEVNEMFSGYAEQGNEEVDDELAQMEKEMAEEKVSLPSANKEDVPQVKVAEPEAKKEEEALGISLLRIIILYKESLTTFIN